MVSKIAFRALVIGMICLFIFAGGCASEADKTQISKKEMVIEEPVAELVNLRLKFTPKDITRYTVKIKSQDSTEFGGTWPEKSEFENKTNLSETEIAFSQKTKSINGKGNAIAKITIKGLKVNSIYQNKPALKFDSSVDADKDKSLAILIGKSYTIEFTPDGEIVQVDANEAQAEIVGKSSDNRMALALLKPDMVKQRHAVVALPKSNRSQLNLNENWSKIGTFDFRLLGSESYEKIYTLTEIHRNKGQKVALIQMNAIPTTETAEELHKAGTSSGFSDMFANTHDYIGELVFNLDSGKIENYTEELHTEWFMVNPKATGQDDAPVTLKMSSIRSYSIQKTRQTKRVEK